MQVLPIKIIPSAMPLGMPVPSLAVATWDESEDKTSYKVQLYKGSKKIDSLITVQSPRYDFRKR